MTKQQITDLAQDFGAKYGSYDGWAFAVEYPKIFAYYHGATATSIFFTPDWGEKGKIGIDVQFPNGEQRGLVSVEYGDFLVAEDLFAIVKGWLDRYGG